MYRQVQVGKPVERRCSQCYRQMSLQLTGVAFVAAHLGAPTTALQRQARKREGAIAGNGEQQLNVALQAEIPPRTPRPLDTLCSSESAYAIYCSGFVHRCSLFLSPSDLRVMAGFLQCCIEVWMCAHHCNGVHACWHMLAMDISAGTFTSGCVLGVAAARSSIGVACTV